MQILDVSPGLGTAWLASWTALHALCPSLHSGQYHLMRTALHLKQRVALDAHWHGMLPALP